MPAMLYDDPDHQPFHLEAGSSSALLIHGFMGTPRDMRPLADALAAAGVTTRGILLPGFGEDRARLRSVRASDWVHAARVAWEELRQNATRATLIGFSMGGAVALSLAAELDQAPDALILLAPHWRFADRRAFVLPVAKHVIRTFRPFGRVDFDNPDTRRLLEAWAPGADLNDPVIRHELRDALSVPTHVLDELRRIGNAAATAARRVSSPTTILQGLHDTTSLPRFSQALAARIGAELMEFPGDHILIDPDRPTWPVVRDAVVRRATGSGAA